MKEGHILAVAQGQAVPVFLQPECYAVAILPFMKVMSCSLDVGEQGSAYRAKNSMVSHDHPAKRSSRGILGATGGGAQIRHFT